MTKVDKYGMNSTENYIVPLKVDQMGTKYELLANCAHYIPYTEHR